MWRLPLQCCPLGVQPDISTTGDTCLRIRSNTRGLRILPKDHKYMFHIQKIVLLVKGSIDVLPLLHDWLCWLISNDKTESLNNMRNFWPLTKTAQQLQGTPVCKCTQGFFTNSLLYSKVHGFGLNLLISYDYNLLSVWFLETQILIRN